MSGIRNRYECATDGGCIPNPGLGAWAFMIDNVVEMADVVENTTNGSMEVLALQKLLEFLATHCRSYKATINIDSEYVIKGVSTWMFTWRIKNWKTSEGKPVLHRDLWEDIYKMYDPKKHVIKYCRSHNGHELNERVDKLTHMARETMGKIENSL
jgi:ribonuclease HI